MKSEAPAFLTTKKKPRICLAVVGIFRPLAAGLLSLRAVLGSGLWTLGKQLVLRVPAISLENSSWSGYTWTPQTPDL